MPVDESSSLSTTIAGLKRRRPDQFPPDCGTLDSDLAQAIAILATRQKPDPSSTPINLCFPSFTHSTLHFFVRVMSRTLVIHAHPDDTVKFVISQIKSITKISTSNHYLTHHGHHLHGDSTLAQCGIQKDSTLQFTTRHPISTDYPRSWHIVTGLVFTINSLADIDNNEELKKQWVLGLIEDFLTTAANYTWGHAEVFILASAPAALVKLFLHANQGMSLFAASAIRRFISTDSYLLPNHVRLKCIPILLEFCKLLSETAGMKSSLYKDCYVAVAALLKEPESAWYSRLNAVDLVCDLLPFLRDAADKVMAGLTTERMLVDRAYLADFSSFLSSMQGAVHNCRLGDGPILKIVYCSKHSEYEDWMGSLHGIFIDLVEKVDHCLRKVESFLSKKWPRINKSFWIVKSSILPVLTECSYFTNIFEGTEEFLCSVLLDRRSALNLLLKYASRNADLCWILRHKSLTDSEARRNVALMLFPRYEEDQLREMLIDRSRLLDESFEYIAQVDADLLRGGLLMEFKDEEATGPGVLREWFCLLCRELFSPQNVLFLACPNDRRRFFPNPVNIFFRVKVTICGFLPGFPYCSIFC